MLDHQLPALLPVASFWDALPEVFAAKVRLRLLSQRWGSVLQTLSFAIALSRSVWREGSSMR
jgi:hypothetical protein